MTGKVAIGVLAVVMRTHAVAAEPLTLSAALARAARTNPEMAGATADLTAAEGRLAQASVLAANPVLAASGTRHRIHMVPLETNVDNAVSLGQELQVGGQRGLRMAAARFDVEHAEAARADRARLVASEVRKAFAGLVAAQRKKVLADEVAAQAKRVAAVAESRLTAGDTGRLDLDLARLDVVKAETDAAGAATDIDRATSRLALALGAEADELFAVTATDEPVRETPPDVDVIARALAARPDLRAARAAQAQLEGQADLTHRVGVVPNPTIRAFYSHENGNETLIGGEIAVPLPIFDRQQGAEVDLRGQAASAAAVVMRLERQIPRDVHVALAHYQAAAATWQRRHREARMPDSVRASLDRALASGLLGLPDVLVQQDRLRDARRADIDAWLDLREAEADVVEAIGDDPW